MAINYDIFCLFTNRKQYQSFDKIFLTFLIALQIFITTPFFFATKSYKLTNPDCSDTLNNFNLPQLPLETTILQ